jgi:hypothetical protein
MVPRRVVLAVLAVLAIASMPLSTAAQPEQLSPPTWKRDERDPRWVQGEVAATASADTVFARLQRVPEWPRMFTDIKSMRIVERGTDHWRVKLETRTFDCGAHEYHVRFEAPRTVRLWIDAPGVSAVAYMRVLDGAAPDTARVISSLFIDARGIAGWFVSKEDLRSKQEQMVVRYLADLERAFRTPATTSAAARTAVGPE